MKATIQLFIYWCLGTLISSCQPTKSRASATSNPCLSKASIRDSFELQVCLDCRTPAQADSFERSLGSVVLPLSDFQFEASIERTWGFTFPPQEKDLVPVNEGRHTYEYLCYERPCNIDRLKTVVLYGTNRGLIHNICQKYFYRDTILESSLQFCKESPLPTDTCSFHSVKEKLWTELNALKVVPAVIYGVEYHPEYFNPYGYMYEVNDRPGEYYQGEIPYQNQFCYYLWSSAISPHVPNKIWSITLQTELSMTDEFYQTTKEGVNGYREQIIYETGPEDLSLRLEVNIHHP